MDIMYRFARRLSIRNHLSDRHRFRIDEFLDDGVQHQFHESVSFSDVNMRCIIGTELLSLSAIYVNGWMNG